MGPIGRGMVSNQHDNKIDNIQLSQKLKNFWEIRIQNFCGNSFEAE